MSQHPHPNCWNKFFSLLAGPLLFTAFTFLFVSSTDIFAADNISGKNSLESQPDSSYSGGKGHVLDKNANAGSFRTGFDKSVPASWSGLSKRPPARIINPYQGYEQIPYQPKFNALDVNGFAAVPEDDGGQLMSKAGELLTAVGGRVRLADRKSVV